MPSSKKMSLREAKAYARSLKDNEAFKIYMQSARATTPPLREHSIEKRGFFDGLKSSSTEYERRFRKVVNMFRQKMDAMIGDRPTSQAVPPQPSSRSDSDLNLDGGAVILKKQNIMSGKKKARRGSSVEIPLEVEKENDAAADEPLSQIPVVHSAKRIRGGLKSASSTDVHHLDGIQTPRSSPGTEYSNPVGKHPQVVPSTTRKELLTLRKNKQRSARNAKQDTTMDVSYGAEISVDAEIQHKEANIYKIKANEALRTGNFLEAVELYSVAIRLGQGGEMLHKYLSNRATAYCRLDQNVHAVEDLQEALKLSPGNGKHLARLAYNEMQLGREHNALRNFRLAAVTANSPSVQRYILELESRLLDSQSNPSPARGVEEAASTQTKPTDRNQDQEQIEAFQEALEAFRATERRELHALEERFLAETDRLKGEMESLLAAQRTGKNGHMMKHSERTIQAAMEHALKKYLSPENLKDVITNAVQLCQIGNDDTTGHLSDNLRSPPDLAQSSISQQVRSQRQTLSPYPST